MSQTKEKCGKKIIFEWYEDAMRFRVFILIVFVNGKKEHMDENDFRHCYGNFIRKQHSESYLITAMFKVPSQELEATLKTTF